MAPSAADVVPHSEYSPKYFNSPLLDIDAASWGSAPILRDPHAAYKLRKAPIGSRKDGAHEQHKRTLGSHASLVPQRRVDPRRSVSRKCPVPRG